MQFVTLQSSVDSGFEGLWDMRLSTEQVKARQDDFRVESQRGFTLVELITIITIIGILAVAAAPRFFDNNVFQERGTADQITAALRYGQKVAIAQRRPVSVNISTGVTPDCGTVLVGANINCVVSNKVAVAPVTVTFNSLGQRVPANPATTVVVGTTTTITI
jgi:MSHA pilin protein MshC